MVSQWLRNLVSRNRSEIFFVAPVIFAGIGMSISGFYGMKGTEDRAKLNELIMELKKRDPKGAVQIIKNKESDC